MNLIKTKDFKEMSEKAFEVIKNIVDNNEQPVVSFTTGGSQTELFRLLVEAINNGTMDISNSIFLNLDEYVGPSDDVYTVKTFMYKELYNKIKQQPKEIQMVNGAAEDKDAEVKRYAAVLEKYPRDVQLLGLGVNGHVGANEPGTPFDSSLFVAKHEESTIQSTMKLFNITREQAPKEMFTMGFKEIMAAKTVLLVASGKSKAEAVKNLLEGEIVESCPASYLRNHPNFVFIVDEDAMSLCENQ